MSFVKLVFKVCAFSTAARFKKVVTFVKVYFHIVHVNASYVLAFTKRYTSDTRTVTSHLSLVSLVVRFVARPQVKLAIIATVAVNMVNLHRLLVIKKLKNKPVSKINFCAHLNLDIRLA